MARKDVNLVIRAKDDASKAVEKIGAALDDFVDSQAGLKGQSKATKAALSTITDAAKKVESSLGSLNVGSKFQQEMDKVSSAIARLEKESTDSNAAVQRVTGNLSRATYVADNYAAKLDGAVAAQERQKAAVKEAKAELKALSAETKKATNEQAALVERQAELPAEIEKQGAALAKASRRYDELSAKMQKAEKPATSLVKAFNGSTNAVNRAKTTLARLEDEYAGIGAAIGKAEAAVIDFSARTEQAAANEERQVAALEKIKANYQSLGVAAKASAKDQRTLETALKATSDSAAKQAADLAVAVEALDDITTASDRAEAALAGLNSEALGSIEQQLVEQGIAARQARDEFADLEAGVSALKHEIGAVGVPTRQMSQELAMAAQAAEQAQYRLMAQEEALGRMSAAYREQSGDLQSIVQTQRSFASAQEQLGRTMQSVASDGFTARQAIRSLHAEMDSGSTQREADNIERLGNEARAAAPKVSSLRQAYNDLYGGSRQALSYTQRLRGEVLSMIAAYGGLYTVVEVLNNVVGAYQKLEAAQSRLGVATGGDQQQAAQEMDFLRRTADRLGIELGVLADEYTKFAIATRDSNLEGERTRKIFLSVAEAARVARIPNEELSGIFKALTQIVNKEKLSLEELQEQLGDRLPRAVKTMADALGISVGELQNLMEQGKVTADSLAPFADQLDKQFGAGLEDSLKGVTASLGRFRNAAFQAMIVFAEGGFIEAFSETLNNLTDLLKSGEFVSFVQKMSAAFAVLADAVSVVADNFTLVGTVIGAALGLKSFGIVMALWGGVKRLGASMVTTAGAARSAAAGTNTLAASSTRATGAVRGLTAGLRALAASTGLGAILAGAGALGAYWLTAATDMNDALATHKDIVDRVKNAYDAVGGSVEGWADRLTDLTNAEAEANLQRITDAVEELENRMALAAQGNDSFLTNFLGYNLAAGAEIFDVPQQFRDAIASVNDEFNSGAIDADAYLAKLDETISAQSDGSHEAVQYGDFIIKLARNLIQMKNAQGEAASAVKAASQDAETAQDGFDELGNAAEDTGKGLEIFREDAEDASEAAEKLRETTGDLKDGFRDLVRSALPQLADHLDKVEESEAFREQAAEVVSLAGEVFAANVKVEDLISTWKEMKGVFEGTSFTGLFVDLLTDADSVIEKFTAIGSLAGGLGEKISAGLSGIGGAFNSAVGGIGGMLSAFGNDFQAKFAASLKAAGMSDDYVRAAFAVAGGESNFDFTVTENPNYSPGRAREIFGAAKGMSDAQLQALVAGGAEKFFEAMYGAGTAAGRRLGNTQAGDGGRFYGRGFIQLTGRSNYERYAAQTGHDIVNNPDLLVKDMKVAVDVAAAYLADRMTETGDAVADVRRAVAGGGPGTKGFDMNIAADRERFGSITIPDAPSNFEPSERLEQGADSRGAAADRQFEIDQQKLINAGREREAEILEAIREEQERNPNATDADLDRVREEVGALYDLREEQERLNESKREEQKLAEDAAAAREATSDTLSDAEFAVRQQQLVNDGLKRQAAIEAGIRDARAADPNITDAEINKLSILIGKQYDLANATEAEDNAKKKAAKSQEVVNQLIAQRTALERQFQAALKAGDGEGAARLKGEVEEVNDSLVKAIDNAKAMWEAVGGQEGATALAQLQTARIEAERFDLAGQKAKLDWTGVADLFVNGLSSAFGNFAQQVANGEDEMKALKNSFLQFAADFLLQLSQMILKQLILNALMGMIGGTSFGTAIGVPVGTGHTGGNVGSKRVGSGNSTRRVNPAMFAGALRYHEGGIPGLKPGEVPIIAKQNEEILTQEDPRHWSNQGGKKSGGGKAAGDAKVYNYFDFESFLEASLSGGGGKAILNHVRANSSEFRAAMEG
jgi:tape measure domain-containing protein